MSFTSGKISHDPEPWIDTEDGERSPDSRQYPWADYAPRPEYDNHNPILIAFREEFAAIGMPLALKYFDETAGPATDTPEHIAHARRVLEKLAALA